MLVENGLGVFLTLAARREQRVVEGSAAGEVVAVLPFLFLDGQKEFLFKNGKQPHVTCGGKQPAKTCHSQLTPTYIYHPLKSAKANAWIT